jgi:hypothetical protein
MPFTKPKKRAGTGQKLHLKNDSVIIRKLANRCDITPELILLLGKTDLIFGKFQIAFFIFQDNIKKTLIYK